MYSIIFFIIALFIAAIRTHSSIASIRRSIMSTDIESFPIEPYNTRFNNESSDPLLVILVFLVVFGFIFSPWVGAILAVVSIFAYPFIKKTEKNMGMIRRREEALFRAGIFLSPYSDIWRNLILSNKYCTLRLRQDGTTIIATERLEDSNSPYRTFKITDTRVFDRVELWNLFCINFSYNTSFDGLLEYCEKVKASVIIDIITPPAKKRPEIAEKVDINNASGAELTALPGISIVISKKIIKKREEIGGFKTVESFLQFLNLNPNVTKNLRERICVKKMNGIIMIERSEERRIDL